MSAHDNEFAKKLKPYLDSSTADLKAGTAYKLQLARQAALARLAPPERAPAVRMSHALAGAGADAGASPVTGPSSRSYLRLGVGILLIALAAFGYQQWQAYQQITELEETDAAILSSDLPIDAYLDRGFQNWLKDETD
jgi:hypothetical protein